MFIQQLLLEHLISGIYQGCSTKYQRLACTVTKLTSQEANTLLGHIKGLREEIQDLQGYGRP